MKKRIFNLLLEIATLCLCVAAIAFGVYSAKTASLNVSGTIGFEAHNCEVGVVAQLSGDGVVTNTAGNIVASPDGNVRRTALDVTANFATADKGTITFGDLYFADLDTVNGKAAPIKMVFNISNKSPFAIKASVTLPKNNHMSILANKDSIRIEQGTTEKPTIGSITITFTLNDPETKLETALNLSGIKFDFAKYDFKKSDIDVKLVDKTNGTTYDKATIAKYYITYGKNNGTAQDWYLMGKFVNNVFVKLEEADVTKTTTDGVDKYTLNDNIDYVFVSKNIFMINNQEKSDYYQYSIMYNNNYSDYDSQKNDYFSLQYPNVSVYDYSISTVREYLNGKSVYALSKDWTPNKDEQLVNFFDTNDLKSDEIYTLIKTRTLESLYTDLGYDDIESASVLKYDVPTNKTEGVETTDSDAFWLISATELLNVITDGGNDQYAGLGGVVVNYWMTRQPYGPIAFQYGNPNYPAEDQITSPYSVLPAMII